MVQEITNNQTAMLLLSDSVRISSNSNFNAQEAYQNTFEEVINDQNSKTTNNSFQEKRETTQPINTQKPAGFLFREYENPQIFCLANAKSALNTYALQK